MNSSSTDTLLSADMGETGARFRTILGHTGQLTVQTADGKLELSIARVGDPELLFVEIRTALDGGAAGELFEKFGMCQASDAELIYNDVFSGMSGPQILTTHLSKLTAPAVVGEGSEDAWVDDAEPNVGVTLGSAPYSLAMS